MDFTREPIIETVITPKEGCKLVVRSSKSTGQEEYFVDAVEVVSFGHSFFFRSLERPKTFFVPATDYEILEVRETRMVLKNVGIDRTIKIGGGREGQMRGGSREPQPEKAEPMPVEEAEGSEAAEGTTTSTDKTDGRIDKKRDRRRNYRRRRGRDGTGTDEEGAETGDKPRSEASEGRKPEDDESPIAQQVATTSILTSLLPPPPTLISETIARYKESDLFKGAFYTKEEHKDAPSVEPVIELEKPALPTEQHEYGTFELSEEEEEEIYQQRKRSRSADVSTEQPTQPSEDTHQPHPESSQESDQLTNGNI